MSSCKADKVNGWSLNAWFPPWSMEEEMWWCGAALLVTLLGIFSPTSMVTTAAYSDMPSHPFWFGFSWTIIYFSTGQWPQTKCSASLGTPSRLLENHFRWLPHEAHREKAKSVQSSNQSKGWLLLKGLVLIKMQQWTLECVSVYLIHMLAIMI